MNRVDPKWALKTQLYQRLLNFKEVLKTILNCYNTMGKRTGIASHHSSLFKEKKGILMENANKTFDQQRI